ncbi:hypothetical protein FACS18945_2180 [Bacteroidia bacterium]|nr:hypothetical protein FACS18945_2180 [Bacteroidia bacterium]
MSKSIQIRRGSAAEHSSFTGLLGEITYNNTSKTMHVHDGATVGGFALARADMSNISADTIQAIVGSANTDITPFLPTDWAENIWNALFDEYNLARKNFAISAECTIAPSPFIDYTFDTLTDVDPMTITADCILICLGNDAGYDAGDIVGTFGVGNIFAPKPNLSSTEQGLHTRLPVGGEQFFVLHKTTGIATPISNAKWKVKFRVWY